MEGIYLLTWIYVLACKYIPLHEYEARIFVNYF